MDEAEYCNKVGMMYEGRLIKIASPDSIKEDLEGSLAAISCNNLEKAQEFMRTQKEVVDVSLHGAQLHALLSSPNAKSKLVKGLKAVGIMVSQFEFVQPTLEDVFTAMIEKLSV
jgi:ABC-2 type transport system ATP-binding protein